MDRMDGKQKRTKCRGCDVSQQGKQHTKAEKCNTGMQQEQCYVPAGRMQPKNKVIQVRPRAEQGPIVGKISNQVAAGVSEVSRYGTQMSESGIFQDLLAIVKHKTELRGHAIGKDCAGHNQ